MPAANAMDPTWLLARRSASQLLDRRIAGGSEAGVRILLAVQAQDRLAWRLALRARVADITAADVNDSLSAKRTLLVAWLNRGTLHLVCREDYPWLLALTAPTHIVASARRLAQEGVPPDEADRGVACIERSLAAEGPLGRAELRQRLTAQGIRTEGQATYQLLFAAVTRGVAVLGPVVAGQQSFALTVEWLGAAPKPLSGEARERALAELARRYLTGHAPATDRDLARWAGLPLRDARLGLRAIGSELVELEGGLLEPIGRTERPPEALPARLLPSFDPSLVGWGHREPFLRRLDEPLAIPPGGGLFRPVATVEGVAAATWGVTRRHEEMAIGIAPFRSIGPEAEAALRAEAEDVARFEGRTLSSLRFDRPHDR